MKIAADRKATTTTNIQAGTVISKDDTFSVSFDNQSDRNPDIMITFLLYDAAAYAVHSQDDELDLINHATVAGGYRPIVAQTMLTDITDHNNGNLNTVSLVEAYNQVTGNNFDKIIVKKVTTVNMGDKFPCFVVEGYTPGQEANAEESKSSSSHVHAFSWQTIREATKDSDGLAQYRCSCGAVEGEQVISKTATTYTGLQKALKNAQAGEHVVYDSGEMFTLSDIMLEQLSQKKDVSAAIDFKYKNKEYTLTIPAGMDYTKFFADKEFFYGFLYFAQETDATVVEK